MAEQKIEQMKPIATSLPVRMTAALDHDAIVASILLDRAASISKEQKQEIIILVAYGPVPDEDNKLWLSDMRVLAEQRSRAFSRPATWR